jgi:replicative superfamily II helicase
MVIDELHMLNENMRGYILELMATKLLSLEQDVQIVGMSATLNVSAFFCSFPVITNHL